MGKRSIALFKLSKSAIGNHDNCQLSTVNCQLSTVNCQLSTVN
ncbi:MULTISPECIES: hypothetical protein [unclassified Microcoleus]|nr:MULTISPECIES: hypothetical protein [unclassified Microcoleus]